MKFEIGTNPHTLTPEERIAYIVQLQKTILFWQEVYCAVRQITRAEMIKEMRKYNGTS